MAVLLRPKKGLWGGQNPPGERHEVDGGGRRPGSSSGRPPSLCVPGGSPAGGGNAGDDPGRAVAPPRSTPAEARSGHRRRWLRQRPVARAAGPTRNCLDRAPPQEPNPTADPGWARLAAVLQAFDRRGHDRLGGELLALWRGLRFLTVFPALLLNA